MRKGPESAYDKWNIVHHKHPQNVQLNTEEKTTHKENPMLVS
jgi:hypothetical protein